MSCIPRVRRALRCASFRRFIFARFFSAMMVPVLGRSLVMMGFLFAMLQGRFFGPGSQLSP